jgi:hypothetical protein
MAVLFPDDQRASDPLMLVIVREGREVAIVSAADGIAAVKEAARLILTQDALYPGMQLLVTRT